MFTVVAGLVVGVLLLYLGADWLVKGGVKIASHLGLSPLIIGLTLVAFATSAPELTVSIDAALEGNGDISVGNVIGSNICNIALILGISAMITPLRVKTRLLRFDVPLLLLVTVIFAALGLWSGGIDRLEGALLFTGLIVYTAWSVYASRREERVNAGLCAECEAQVKQVKAFGSWFWSVGLVVAGLAALIYGAQLLVNSAVTIGQNLGFSDAVIALTVVAVGTSLPELATSVVAALHRQQDIAIGNVVGSNIFNILGIMGLAPLIAPVQTVNISRVDWGMMVFLAALLLPFMRSRFVVSRLEGTVLLLIFVGYLGYLGWSH